MLIVEFNRPCSIYQYSNMTLRLSGQTSIFGVVFFVSKSLLGIEGQRELEKFAILTQKPRSHARILILYIERGLFYPSFSENSTVVLQVPGFPLPSHLQDGGQQKFVKNDVITTLHHQFWGVW